jgi:hypothetical protein
VFTMIICLVRDRQEEQNKEDQTNLRDTRILTWKTLQSEGKNHGHQPATTFTIFVECLQEHRDLFWPKPPDDGPPLRSSTWSPLRNLDHNSTCLVDAHGRDAV